VSIATAKLSVCILTETFHPVIGGGETQARALADGLVSRGFDVRVLTRRSDPSFAAAEALGAIRITRVGPVGPGQLKKWGLLFTAFAALVRQRREYDLLFVSGFRILGIPAVLVSRLFGKVCILKADSLGEFSGQFFERGLERFGVGVGFAPFRLFLAVRNRLFLTADRFVAISDAVEREFLANGVPSDAIERIPNGIDVARFEPVSRGRKASLREGLGFSDADVIVVYTGRLVSYKGLPLLLRVFDDLRKRYPRARLLLVGAGGLDIDNCEDELRRFVTESGLESLVRFTGPVENVEAYLQASDVFVFPTEEEAFGISLVEAMACGLPVVSTEAGGLADIMSLGEFGVSVSIGSEEEVRLGLERLLSDVERRCEGAEGTAGDCRAEVLGREARRVAEENFGMEVVLDQAVALFETVAKRAAGGPTGE
jgi:glycosyltransferase involved in cell wall biosynthesis